MSNHLIPEFLQHIHDSAAWLRKNTWDEIILIHHNDADGLSSGAILYRALYRENHRVRRIALEKPYPEALSRIIESVDDCRRTLLLLTDFASGMLPILEDLLPAGLNVLILDHHQLSTHTSEQIRLVNPTAFAFSGRTEATASTVCYLFARSLSSWNTDLALTALIGILGDGQYRAPLSVDGLNSLVLQDAVSHGTLSLDPEPAAMGRSTWPLTRIVECVNALGSIGYFEGGTDIAVKGLIDGWGIEADTVGQNYLNRFSELKQTFISSVSIKYIGRLAWFLLDQEYQKFGVKTVGLLCEELISRGLVNDGSYLLGIQPVYPQVPGVGTLGTRQEKVSMRVTPSVLATIERGTTPSLIEVLPAAAHEVGGFVDACHPHAAAVTISPDRRDAFLTGVAGRLGGGS